MMLGLELRKAVTADLPDIHAIEIESFADDAWDFEVFASILTESDVQFMVACLDNVVVGYYVLSFKSSERAKIGAFAVKSSHRRTGIAKLMMENILLTCSNNSRENIMLEVKAANNPAISLYSSFDFVIESHEKDYYGEGMDGYIMWRRMK